MAGIATPGTFPAGISTSHSPSPSLPTARPCAIARRVSRRSAANPNTWAFAAAWGVQRWLMRANKSRDWRIYADFAQVLIGIARPLSRKDPLGLDLDQSLYAPDSTTIDFCLSVFPWAKLRKRKGAVKMYTLLDLHGNSPTFIRITNGK